MLIVVGDATAVPGRRDELVAAARAVAAAARGDRGCVAYSFAADLQDDNRIMSLEIWADRAALDEHMTHPHTEEFLRAASSLVAGRPVMSVYDVPPGEL